MTEVVGKSREEIQRITADYSRTELVDLIYHLASLDIHFSPRQVAAARNLSTEKIVKLIKAGKLRAHLVDRHYRIARQDLLAWDRNTSLAI